MTTHAGAIDVQAIEWVELDFTTSQSTPASCRDDVTQRDRTLL